MINFAIVGGGWRSNTYLTIAKLLPNIFKICGIVVRNAEKGSLIEKTWNIKTYQTIEELLKVDFPEFIVVAVSWNAAPEIVKNLIEHKIPILSETPPAPDLKSLKELYSLVKNKNIKYQVAEQYHLQPLHAARIKIIQSGILGEIREINISVCHGYHAISLIRKMVGLKYENVAISAQRFIFPIVRTHNRDGKIENMMKVNSSQVIATLNFGNKFAIYNFSDEQYFSWIRSPQLTIRGDKGEIHNKKLTYIKDNKSPVELYLNRMNAGEDGNLEGYYLKGILGGNEWVYKNPFIPARLTDDEIAVSTCLYKMHQYLAGGAEFYSLSEAAQDHYLSILIEESAKTGNIIHSKTQPWAFS